MSDLLSVENLCTYYSLPIGKVRAVDGISFSVKQAETLGIAGETGCGKSTTVMSILRLVKPPGKIVQGKVFFRNVDMLSLPKGELQKLRWEKISVVFQQSMYTLNPMLRIEEQMIEPFKIHKNIAKASARKKAAELLRLVGIEESRLRSYPHELSGGMKQRVLIAMSLILEPELVILDEPTTALDVVVQQRIIKLIQNLKAKLGLSVVWITHDLSILSEISDRIMIMYAGKIVEMGDAADVLLRPKHPYTEALLGAVPTLEKKGTELASIPGSAPDLIHPSAGCRFSPRCSYATDLCHSTPPKEEFLSKSHYIECHHWREIANDAN